MMKRPAAPTGPKPLPDSSKSSNCDTASFSSHLEPARSAPVRIVGTTLTFRKPSADFRHTFFRDELIPEYLASLDLVECDGITEHEVEGLQLKTILVFQQIFFERVFTSEKWCQHTASAL